MVLLSAEIFGWDAFELLGALLVGL